MSLSIEEMKNIAAAIQSIATVASFIVGGIWVYSKYIRQQERYPNIEFSADVQFIGNQGGDWLVEVIASIENKGKTQHKMEEFSFDLNALEKDTEILTSEKWGNQVDFPLQITRGSFLPASRRFFFIDPGIKAKYSYLAKVPANASFVILHAWFNYGDNRNFSHSAERTVAVPRSDLPSSLQSSVTLNGAP